MTNYNNVICGAVRVFMALNRLNQKDIAEILGVSQATISARLNGKSRWSLDDIDLLVIAGAKIPSPMEVRHG